jgi:DNA-binding NtrC family response regulator
LEINSFKYFVIQNIATILLSVGNNFNNNKSIDIVNDEEDIFTLFKVLQDNGYQIKGFTNPLIALDYIKNHPDEFGLIIVDYRMSPMQGCELSNKISEINPKIKMIVISAYDNVTNMIIVAV